ncbi:fimbrial protein [Pseudomonas poae]|uniref:Fimbrial protein n=1 Tax=Pseudomonas poae TaxID=200451 RepID=A0A2S9EYJ3_9PSED|nr:fimbrial protein [Pseudomonas poae]PRA30386.1 fimbrial protein [Pseudomonas poae]PRC22270.1 fimbrial protein [Pseudomonas poae]
MKHSIKVVSTLLALGLPISAQALCTAYPNVQYGVSFPSTIEVPRNLPVGGQIASQAFGGPFPSMSFRCGTGMSQVWTGRFYSSTPWSGGEVFHTNVPGVGMRIIQSDNYETPYSVSLRNGSKIWPSNSNYKHHITTLRAEFFKIGPITTGTLDSGNVQDSALDGHRGRIQKRLNNSIRFVQPSGTCNLAAGDVNRTITLPAIKTSQLTGEVGKQSFDLTALCESDIRTVFFRFTGTPSTGNAVLFANTGTAKGVGLSLSHRNVAYIPANGSSGARTREITTSGGRAVLPMNAAYDRTGATVNAGTLVSSITVSITYN